MIEITRPPPIRKLPESKCPPHRSQGRSMGFSLLFAAIIAADDNRLSSERSSMVMSIDPFRQRDCGDAIARSHV